MLFLWFYDAAADRKDLEYQRNLSQKKQLLQIMQQLARMNQKAAGDADGEAVAESADEGEA